MSEHKSTATHREINLKVINEVMITAGIGYDSYLKFTDEYSKAGIELFINQSSLDLDQGIIPVFIHFPKVSFESVPYQVWITCIVNDPPEPFLYAFDGDGNVVDRARSNQGEKVDGAVVYKLESDTEPIRKIGILGRGIRIIDICYPVHHAVSTTNILVTMPEEVVKADVHLSKNSQGTVYSV